MSDNPLVLMDDIERDPINGCFKDRPIATPKQWQCLRAAVEAQAAKIELLERGQVLAIQSLRDGWNQSGTCLLVASALQDIVNAQPRQSAVELRARELERFANRLGNNEYARCLRIEADRIRSEANQQSDKTK